MLAITDFYHPRAGGVERVVRETARCLAGLGVEVEILTRRLTPAAPALETVDGVVVHRIGSGPGPMPFELAALYAEGGGWAAQHLHRFDVVHAHLSFVAGAILGRIGAARMPLVATFYGPWHREYLEELGDPAIPSRWPQALRRNALPMVASLLRRWQGRVLRASGSIVVLSEHSRRELASDFAINSQELVERIPGGVDLTRFQPAERTAARNRLRLRDLGRPLLVTVRRLVPRMGLESLLDAVQLLAAEHPGLALAVAGIGDLGPSLEARAAELGLGERVRWLGYVADDDLPYLYSAADLAVVPTRALEGFGLPVLEAWACGTPVVSTPVGALAETVRQLDPDFVASGANTAALATAISCGLVASGAPLRERSRSLARSYGWEGVTARYLEVYYRAVHRRPEN